MNVVLVAEESAGIGALRQLAQGPHRLVAVLAREAVEGVPGATVAGVARRLEVPVWPAELVRDPDLGVTLREMDVDLLLNVHSLYIVDPAVVAAPTVGSFNLHPGPLPRYAGLNAPSWAILEGEREHAVTLHWMDAGIDTGAVAYEQRFSIAPDATGLAVALECVRRGLALIARLLEDAPRGAIPVLEQKPGERRYHDGRPPYDGTLPWTLPAGRVVDLVRACDYRPFPSPWGQPSTRSGGGVLRIVEVSATGEATARPPGTVGPVDEHGARVAAADEWVLVRRLRRDDEPVADAAEVLRSGDTLA